MLFVRISVAFQSILARMILFLDIEYNNEADGFLR